MGPITLKQKIFFGFTALIVLPLWAVTAISAHRSAAILEDKTQQQVRQVCDTVNEQFNIFFRDIDVISQDILSDSTVQDTLRRPKAEMESQPYQSLRLQLALENDLLGIRIRKPGIHSILIYGLNGQNYSTSPGWSWDRTYDASCEAWFAQAKELDGGYCITGVRRERQLLNYGMPQPEVVTFARIIKDQDTFRPLGMLQINIQLDYLEQCGREAVQSGNIAVLDGAGGPVFTVRRDAETGDAIVVESQARYTGWRTVYYAPRTELLKETQETQHFLWLASAAVTVLGILFAQLLTRSITKPLGKLHEQMSIVSCGDFTVQLQYDKQDEMGALIEDFNQMTRKIRILVEQIHEKEEQRRKTEVDALQSQINPHFIYNTLNSIRLTAMLHKDKEITEQVTAFVYLLKQASQNGGRAVTIGQDLEIIRSYCALMKYRYDNFTLTVSGQETVEDCSILPFILQPLVENAIFHGIAALKRQGNIRMEFTLAEGIVCMTLSDDGVGMDAGTVERLLSGEDRASHTFNHLGLKNVRARMRLYYGERAEMEVRSKVGEGTVISLRWPALRTEELYAEGANR